MSYEGSREYLTQRGFYETCDCHDDLTFSKISGEPFIWVHSIDSTNGYDECDPNTYPAAKEIIGAHDVWSEDRHGNKYAVTVNLYKPHGDQWRQLPHPPIGE